MRMRQSDLVRVNPNEVGRRKAIGMVDFRDSDIYRALTRDGLRGKGAGTPERRVNEKAGSASFGAHRQVEASAPVSGEEDRKRRHSPMTHEPREEDTAHDGPSPARQNRPVLAVVNSRNGRAHAPRVSPPGARPFLVLLRGGKL